MRAIYKREIKAYFNSAIGYVYLTVFLFFSGLFVSIYNLASGSGDMSGLFSDLMLVSMIMVPILTMKLMSEEKKQKTDQALLTAPVGLSGIVIGKFLAALTIYTIGLSTTILYAIVFSFFGTIDTWVIIGNMIGSFLMGAAFIAIGMFISNLTENQVVAAVGSIAVLLLLFIIQSLENIFTGQAFANIINFIALSQRYSNFATGIFNVSDAVYFFSLAAVFIFLTVRTLESRRWS